MFVSHVHYLEVQAEEKSLWAPELAYLPQDGYAFLTWNLAKSMG